MPPLPVSENVVNSATFTCVHVIHQMKQQQSVLEFQLTPFNILLRAVLSQLQEKDKYSIFAQPVSTKEVGVSTHTHTCHSQILIAEDRDTVFSVSKM